MTILGEEANIGENKTENDNNEDNNTLNSKV